MSDSYIIEPRSGEKFYAVKSAHLASYPFLREKVYVRVWEDQQARRDHRQYPETVFLKVEDYLSYVENVKIEPNSTTVISQLEEALVGAILLLKQGDVGPSVLKICSKVSECIYELNKTFGVQELLSQMTQNSDARKHLLRTIFCKHLSFNLGWTNENNLQRIFLASLLSDLSPDPAKNALQLQALGMHSDIVLAVRHAKENSDGSGPLKIKKHHIYGLSKVIRVADELAKGFVENKNPREIMRGLEKNTPVKYDTNVVRAALKLWT